MASRVSRKEESYLIACDNISKINANGAFLKSPKPYLNFDQWQIHRSVRQAYPLDWHLTKIFKNEEEQTEEFQMMQERQHDVWGGYGAVIEVSNATLGHFS